MLSGHFTKFCAFALAIFQASAITANAIEIVAQKSDTFIFEGIPSGEFSKSDFIATAHVKGERAIAYLPFVFKVSEFGIQPENDEISDCKLTLFIKSLPSLPESNARDSSNEVEKVSKREMKIEEEKGLDEKAEEKIDEAKEYVGEKLEAESKTKIEIIVYGVCDTETFEPNARNFRVSWDGKHDGVAPKHNTLDNKLEETGLYELGKIEFDIETDEYEDGDRFEFVSPELNMFVRFALGITSAHKQAPVFRSPLNKIENAAIVLMQKSGPSGVFFFSADSMNDKVGKEQSGDEVEKAFKRQKKVDTEGNTISENDESALENQKAQADKSVGEISKNSGVEQAIGEAKKSAESANSAAAEKAQEKKEKKSSDAKESPDNLKKNASDESADDIEFVKETTPDRRPRIDFDCRREESNSAAPETPAKDDSVQIENMLNK